MSRWSARRGRRRKTPRPLRPQRTGLRAAAFALLCAVAAISASQILRTVHLAVEPHVPCVHGRLVHVLGHHHGDHHETSEAQPSRGGQPGAWDAEAHSSQHQHCDAIAAPQAPMPTVQADIAPQLLAWLIQAPQLGPADARRSIELLDLAPKLSPPQA